MLGRVQQTNCYIFVLRNSRSRVDVLHSLRNALAMTASASRLESVKGNDGFQRLAPRPFESPLALTERAVAGLETRCRRQRQIVVELKEHHVGSAVLAARELLDDLECSLRLARRTLRQLRDQDHQGSSLR